MNVYIVRYENLDVYSTARKAIESLIGRDWDVFYEGDDIPINEENVSKLIAKLNKSGFLQISSGRESGWIEKETVQ